MADRAVDAFILFNEAESGVAEIVEQLEARGVSTYFWRRDVPPGAMWAELEATKLREARSVLVFLGDAGWGPNHLRITEEAQKLEKRIIPLLIGDPGKEAFKLAVALFRDRRYLDLRQPGSLDRLVGAVRQREVSAQIDRIVNVLIDGNEKERADVIGQVLSSSWIDRPSLATRLRTEILKRFAPDAEGRFAAAVRDPKRISSIRSWMLSALIRIDVEGQDSRDLVLHSLKSSWEPERNVRFWVLAGLYEMQASYLAQAVQMTAYDDAPEVAALAQAIRSPESRDLAGEFSARLYAPEFETVWHILRVLRIVAIPELAADVCKQLGRVASDTSLTYDALYALSNPEMARAAVEHLPVRRGVELVLDEARNADHNSIRNFTVLLAAFDDAELTPVLDDAERNPGIADVVRLIRHFLAQHRRGGEVNDLFVAGYASDVIDIEKDPLGVQEDVQTLTAVMMAEEVKPPLAIGLFGDWGTGKSYFMKSMRAAAEAMAAGAKSSRSLRFCSNIVPIEFNAWHYVDTNLWASLVSTILEKLSAHVTPRKTPEEQQAALLSELESAKAAASEAEGEKERAQTLITQSEEELQRLQLERQQKEIRLRDLRTPDLKELLSDEEKANLDTLLDQLGIPAALHSIADLSQVVSDGYTVRGRLAAVTVSILNAKHRKPLLIVGGITFIGVPVASYLANRYLDVDRLVLAGSALIAQAGAIVAGAATVLRKAFTLARTNLEKLEEKKRRVDKLAHEKRQNPTSEELQLQEEIAKLRAREQEASSRLSAAVARVVDLEERLRALKEGRSLARFLAERTRSEDYRRHLGLVSTIRQDFESLAERLAGAARERTEELRPVDRIILFIDDLDRCPTDKVVEVLQAVHLLLAYPLFVVVVGVDPRWLLHSLGTTYSAFEGDGARFGVNPDLWRTTPQNYLEKIFQIPFNLSRMTDTGYGNLIRGLLTPEGAPEIGSTEESRRQIAPPKKPGLSERPTPGMPQPIQGDQPVKPPVEPERPVFVIQEEALVIRNWEADFAARLFPLIPTPRAAKRFSNTYRILKARVGRGRLAQFEGTEQVPGEFQIPMLLLAILIGAPKDAAKLFPRLLRHAEDGQDATEILRRLDEPGFEMLKENVGPVVTDDGFPCAAEIYREWLPRVSRFSFEVGRAVPSIGPTAPAGQTASPPL